MITVFIALTFSANAAPEKEMKKDLALDGYCPVCYIAAGKANKGSSEFTSEHNGKTYQFVSTGTKAMFDKEPSKFLPQYDGYCAYGLSLGKKFDSDPTVFSVIDGKIYLNKTPRLGTCSPARIQRPQILLRHNNRYSISVPCGAMFEPVPPVALPLRALANIFAAAMMSLASKPATWATR